MAVLHILSVGFKVVTFISQQVSCRIEYPQVNVMMAFFCQLVWDNGETNT